MAIFKIGTVKNRGHKRRHKLYPLKQLYAGKADDKNEKENINSEIEEGNENFENRNDDIENDRADFFGSEDQEQYLNYDDEYDNEVEEEKFQNSNRILDFDDDVDAAHENLHLQITETLYKSG